MRGWAGGRLAGWGAVLVEPQLRSLAARRGPAASFHLGAQGSGRPGPSRTPPTAPFARSVQNTWRVAGGTGWRPTPRDRQTANVAGRAAAMSPAEAPGVGAGWLSKGLNEGAGHARASPATCRPKLVSPSHAATDAQGVSAWWCGSGFAAHRLGQRGQGCRGSALPPNSNAQQVIGKVLLSGPRARRWTKKRNRRTPWPGRSPLQRVVQVPLRDGSNVVAGAADPHPARYAAIPFSSGRGRLFLADVAQHPSRQPPRRLCKSWSRIAAQGGSGRAAVAAANGVDPSPPQ